MHLSLSITQGIAVVKKRKGTGDPITHMSDLKFPALVLAATVEVKAVVSQENFTCYIFSRVKVGLLWL